MILLPLAFWPGDLKTWADVIGTAVTTIAVVVGAIWAYFKFVRGRTFRPRLEVGLFGQWRIIDDQHLLHARITVKNIGASKVDLLQEGTALAVYRLKPTAPSEPDTWGWDDDTYTAHEILEDHQWIEPGETVSDDLLLHLLSAPEPVLFRGVLRWKWASGERDIVIVTARKIIPVEARLDGTEDGGEAAEEGASASKG
jgi:hypothetical protein